MPKIKKQEHNTKLNRKEEVTLARIRIGHTFLTHSYLLKGEDQPFCIPCQTPFTIKHILTDCIDFTETRKNLYKENNIKDIFEKNGPQIIFSYFKKIGLYQKI